MSKLDQMSIGGVNYDIKDRDMPSTLGTAGQVLKVNSLRNGLVWADEGGDIVFGTAYNPVTNKAATLADITSAISASVTTALNTPV